MQKRTSPLKFGDLAEKSGLNSVSNLSTKALGMSPPCIDSDAATVYLARADVKKALHVDQSPNEWALCTTQVPMRYTKDTNEKMK